ncbi:MAG: hypothetical protein BRC40_12915 [Cyanobacteria bacterium QH_8_48_120]|nr:MAG: hypothetical protein BRC40_12915 [Cyanobacteria bacterium QH_8_48_120]
MGPSKGRFSTKIHATMDASGNPLSFYLTPAEAYHLDGADKLLAELVADTVLAEKAYHPQERVIEQEEGNTAVIPPKRNPTTLGNYNRQL